MIKGIMFDKDGTLIILDKFWFEPCKKTVEYMLSLCESEKFISKDNYTAQLTNEEKIQRLMMICGFLPDGNLLQGMPVQAGTNEDVLNACIQELNNMGITPVADIFDKAMNEFHNNIYKYGNPVAYADLPRLFKKLKDKGIKIGIATSDEYEITKYCLDKLCISEFTDYILSADRVASPKPAPDTAMEFFRLTGLKPSEVLMVGDSENDIRFAKNSKVSSVRFMPDIEKDYPTEADFIIHDLNDILRLIEII